MSKKDAYEFLGTLDNIRELIKKLPPVPNEEWLKEWNEFIPKNLKKQIDHREFYHKKTKLRARFDPAKEGKPGFEGKDHWHIYNPKTKNKLDTYLDKDGNPTKYGGGPSHIIPKKNGEN